MTPEELQALQQMADQRYSDQERKRIIDTPEKGRGSQFLAGVGDAIANAYGGRANAMDLVARKRAAEKAEKLNTFDQGKKAAVQNYLLKKKEMKEQDELLKVQEAQDPNSEVSKAARQRWAPLLGKKAQDIDGMSFQELEQFGKLYMEADQDDRDRMLQEQLESSRAARQSKRDSAIDKRQQNRLDKEQRTQINGLRKEANSKKSYEAYQQANKIATNIEAFSKDPDGYTDFATLMTGLKSMQGDDSVIREAEMRLGKNAASLMVKAQNAMEQAITGKSLQPEQRQQILRVVQAFRDSSRAVYERDIEPIKNFAIAQGLPMEQIFAEEFRQEAKKPEEDTVQRKTKDGRMAIFDNRTKKFLRYADE